eukprot:GHVR01146190.1.p2 GENE.GHVR01146190.1~~GHVR01146190.1.p2  ORF type:complete len:105 (-),score=5.94 GHVR01146190.1:193-507(-)
MTFVRTALNDGRAVNVWIAPQRDTSTRFQIMLLVWLTPASRKNPKGTIPASAKIMTARPATPIKYERTAYSRISVFDMFAPPSLRAAQQAHINLKLKALSCLAG